MDEPITDVNSGMVSYLKTHPLWIVIPLVVFVAATVFILIYPAVPPGDRWGSVAVIFLLLVIVPLGVVQQKVQDEFMRQFAAANGYRFSVFSGDYGTLDGSLFRLGNGTRNIRDVVSGTYLGLPIALFDYAYETGSGKNREVHRYTVFQLGFDTAMPDLLLEKKSFFSSDSLMGRLPEHIKLEGDFDKEFNLTIKKGYEVEALEIFTPDVMAELMDKCRNFSLEIVNDHLFIYDNKTVGNKADLDALYGVARYFAETLGPVLARMKPALEAQAEVAAEMQGEMQGS